MSLGELFGKRKFFWVANKADRRMMESLLRKMLVEIVHCYFSGIFIGSTMRCRNDTRNGNIKTYIDVLSYKGDVMMRSTLFHFRGEVGEKRDLSSRMELRAYFIDKNAFGWDAPILNEAERLAKTIDYVQLKTDRMALDIICNRCKKIMEYLKLPVTFTWQTHEPID